MSENPTASPDRGGAPTAGLGLAGAGLAAAVLALALTACHRPPASDAGAAAMFREDHGLITVPAGSPLRSHMAVEAVGAPSGSAMVELPGQVEADPARVANVMAPLTGRVVALKARLGERVRQGQVLAVLASGDAAAAAADVEKAADIADLARRALERAKGVRAAGGSADKDLEAARSADTQAQAELTRARARLAAVNGGAAGRELLLTAPQSGVVTVLAVGQGQQVTDPTAVLMTVANTDQVFVTANAPENAAGAFRVGAAADIILAADPDHPLHGAVSEVDALLQPDTRRQKIRIRMANRDGRLLPNMYATVRLAGRTTGGVFVPQSALLMNNDATTVLVEVRPWVFQRRTVRIGDETETSVRVLSGLAAGERVVVRGGVLLDD